ncbi:hypothetical protein [Colwellia sp. KU-HH00111]|uniref:hypothetical protein n=1 Tax=Colwellia sp. KU-HH00111 TaxID=3127652 RepID=UPI0033658559
MEKFLAFLILALSLNTNLAHANKLAAMAATKLTERIVDELNDLPEGKCMNADAFTPDRSDISNAIIQSIANDRITGLFTIDTSVCKKIGGASSSDIEKFAISISNEFSLSTIDVKACCVTPVFIKQ